MYRRPAQLTEQTVSAAHQRALNELLAEFNRQMDVTWTLLDLDNLDATRKAWLQHAVQVVSDHQEQAAEVAAQFCQDWAQVFTGQGMDILKPGLQADKVIRDAETALDALGPAGVKKRIAQGISPEAASRAALDAVKAGGAHRVLDADRQTIIRSAHNDPRCTGWRRVTHGGCKFCNMLAGRGEVYTAESVRFASHDHCRCTAVPAYGGPEVNVHQYTASKRKISDKQRAQLKRYLDDLEDDGVTVKEDATSPTLAGRGGSSKPPSKPPSPPKGGTADEGARKKPKKPYTRHPDETVEQRIERQRQLKSDMSDLEAHDDLPVEALESHEIDFLEDFEAMGHRARWIRRQQNRTASNDFIWLDNGEQACELKCTSPKYGKIADHISRAADRAMTRHGVVKDVFIIDTGKARLPDKVRRQLTEYNVKKDKGHIRRLYVMSEDGTKLEEIELLPRE